MIKRFDEFINESSSAKNLATEFRNWAKQEKYNKKYWRFYFDDFWVDSNKISVTFIEKWIKSKGSNFDPTKNTEDAWSELGDTLPVEWKIKL